MLTIFKQANLASVHALRAARTPKPEVLSAFVDDDYEEGGE